MSGGRRAFLVLVIAVSLSGLVSAAQEAPAKGFRAEFLADWDDFAKKCVSLAEAMPAEKYTWRPNADVRSVSEIYLHMVQGNYFYTQMLGAQSPAGLDLRALEKSTTDKAKIVDLLKQSFEQVRRTALATSDADLDKAVKMFNRDSTARNGFYTIGTHQHEHFGLCIAYARTCNVVPPWTAARQAVQPPKKQ